MASSTMDPAVHRNTAINSSSLSYLEQDSYGVLVGGEGSTDTDDVLPPQTNGHQGDDDHITISLSVSRSPTTSTPIAGEGDGIDMPEESAICPEDSTSDKDCPIEFSIDDSDLLDRAARISAPIVGYEIMDERARFTVFKIHVRVSASKNWFVFRRYTDFIWLNDQLRTLFPVFRLHLPPKRWFGDNFSSGFLEERQSGLQAFINNIMGHREVSVAKPVRDFLCLDDPPGPHESLEESRALCECLEESMCKMRQQLGENEQRIGELEDQVEMYKARAESLEKVLKLERASHRGTPLRSPQHFLSQPNLAPLGTASTRPIQHQTAPRQAGPGAEQTDGENRKVQRSNSTNSTNSNSSSRGNHPMDAMNGQSDT